MSKIREHFHKQQEDRLYPEPWPDQQVALGVPPRPSGSGYTLQILAPKKALRVFRFYPSRKNKRAN